MMVSTKGRYALRILTDLAVNGKENYVSLTDVSNRQGVSLKYLETIVAILYKEGFLDSMRGKNGGYKLKKAPEEISLNEVLLATEGTLAPVACVGGKGGCDRAGKCLTLPLWKKLDSIIGDYLSKVTIADLLNGTI